MPPRTSDEKIGDRTGIFFIGVVISIIKDEFCFSIGVFCFHEHIDAFKEVTKCHIHLSFVLADEGMEEWLKADNAEDMEVAGTGKLQYFLDQIPMIGISLRIPFFEGKFAQQFSAF